MKEHGREGDHSSSPIAEFRMSGFVPPFLLPTLMSWIGTVSLFVRRWLYIYIYTYIYIYIYVYIYI